MGGLSGSAGYRERDAAYGLGRRGRQYLASTSTWPSRPAGHQARDEEYRIGRLGRLTRSVSPQPSVGILARDVDYGLGRRRGSYAVCDDKAEHFLGPRRGSKQQARDSLKDP